MNLVTFGSWTWLWETLNGLFLVICNLIYMLISLLYQVFNAVAKVNLFSDEVFKDITSRIYVVMGIAMLFIFAYNIILMIINPEDKKSTGSTAKVVKETVISLVLPSNVIVAPSVAAVIASSTVAYSVSPILASFPSAPTIIGKSNNKVKIENKYFFIFSLLYLIIIVYIQL